MDRQRSQAVESRSPMICEDACTVCYCEGGVADGAMEVAVVKADGFDSKEF